MPIWCGKQRVTASDIDSGAATDGQVLTADGAGMAAWEDAAGGGGCTDITYADLVTAIGASTLTVGGWYRITDFATKHYIVDADFTQYTTGDGIVTGATEPLIVLAVAANKLSGQAYSQTYPQDVIYYDWDPANWLGDYSFATGGDTIIAGWTGVITYRNDTILNNYAYFDYRQCKFRRWTLDAATWDNATEYNLLDWAKSGSIVYMALQTGTNKAPETNPDYWLYGFALSYFEYWCASPSGLMGCPASATYADFTMFSDAISANNHIDACGLFGYTMLPNNVFRGEFYNNTLAVECFGNTFGFACEENILSTHCYNNVFGDGCVYDTLSPNCGDNLLGPSATMLSCGANLSANIIGQGCTENTFGIRFEENIIGDSCSYNMFGANFSENVMLNNVQYNTTVGAIDGVDFTGASHVYAAYGCELYLDATLGARLRYVDNDVLIYTAVTA